MYPIIQSPMKGTDNPSEMTAEQQPWYAIRTFNCQEQKVSRYLTEKGCNHFIPMILVKKSCENNKEKQILVPAIHNLLFVQKKGTQQDMKQLFSECNTPISIFRQPGVQQLCEIPAKDMTEIRMLCDPQFETSVYMTQGEAEAMEGKEVRVVHGPFKGAVGRLVRKQKHYYFLKVVAGLGVMVRVSRWYCEAV